MTESSLQSRIRLALGADPRVVLWRNNVGRAEYWANGRAQYVAYGLAEGSADLVGLVSPSGRFLALEVKAPGKNPTQEQLRWLELVRHMGGHAAIVHSVDEAMVAVEEACR